MFQTLIKLALNLQYTFLEMFTYTSTRKTDVSLAYSDTIFLYGMERSENKALCKFVIISLINYIAINNIQTSF